MKTAKREIIWWMIKNFFENKKHKMNEAKEKLVDLGKGLPEEMKDTMINESLTTCSKVLFATMVTCNLTEEVSGTCIFPNGEKWVLTFKKISP